MVVVRGGPLWVVPRCSHTRNQSFGTNGQPQVIRASCFFVRMSIGPNAPVTGNLHTLPATPPWGEGIAGDLFGVLSVDFSVSRRSST